jgi:hypothetical protein
MSRCRRCSSRHHPTTWPLRLGEHADLNASVASSRVRDPDVRWRTTIGIADERNLRGGSAPIAAAPGNGRSCGIPSD